MSIIVRCVGLLLLLCPLGNLRAQARSLPTAFDMQVGLGRGLGGSPVPARGMLSGSLVLSKPVRALSQGALLVAASASADLLLSLTDCLNDVAGPPLGCREYPSHVSIGALGGWARRDDQGSGLRLLAGPGYFSTSDSRSGLGAIARIDGAERMTARLSFVFWAQGAVPPAARGERLTVVSGGIGVRVHGR